MNKKLLQQSALDCLKQCEFAEQTVRNATGHAAWLALAFSRLDENKALHWLKDALANHREGGSVPASAPSSLPVYGWLLGHLYQTSKNKPALLKEIRSVYCGIVALHQDLYTNYDLSRDGLIATAHGETSEGMTSSHTLTHYVEEPFFNTMLIWSNEHLIRIGGLLGEDVLELIEWNDLAIWSMNKKLWDKNASCYLPYDLRRQSKTGTPSKNSFLPMAAGVPTQEQAEVMHESLLQQTLYPHEWTLNWFLYKGLLRYEMRETAADLKRETLAAALPYPADTIEKAAIALEWLCANR
ncbi:MAG: trehalase family glycosidase [Saprospiraceae bacterium]|nr:trehalase family glycosidase [Saprospiraceae bacterium]MDZ4706379.1 trehalase family glycosidase [Saprospiraceae bacterium]